jgi:hypothetical protein
MIRHLRVDVLELAYAKQGATYGAARQDCLECAHTSDCQRWIESGVRARPTFCPNLHRFEQFATL